LPASEPAAPTLERTPTPTPTSESASEPAPAPETSSQEHGSTDTAGLTEPSVASTSSGLTAQVEEEEKSPIIEKLRSLFSEEILAYRFDILDDSQSRKVVRRTLVEDVKLCGHLSVAFRTDFPRDVQGIETFLYAQYQLDLEQAVPWKNKKRYYKRR
jgi:hypothetical protein